MTCSCGEWFPLAATGRPRRFCSDVCRMRAWRALNKPARPSAHADREARVMSIRAELSFIHLERDGKKTRPSLSELARG